MNFRLHYFNGAALYLLGIILLQVMRSATHPTYYVNENTISITSAIFNPSETYSPWVDRMFGRYALYRLRDRKRGVVDFLSEQDRDIRSQTLNETYHLPHDAFNPTCSMEFLGFARSRKDRPIAFPGIGQAALHVNHQKRAWRCYYRARDPIYILPTSFHMILYYCFPAQAGPGTCELLKQHSVEGLVPDSSTHLALSTKLLAEHPDWVAQFTVNLTQISQKVSMQAQNESTSKPIAMCLVVPYSANQIVRREMNGAQLFEWIRYHSRLGMKLFVFDRGGEQLPYVFNSPYSRNSSISEHDVMYHNYTIAELLGANNDRGKHDITPAQGSARNRMDFDKMLTLTHCRFQLKSLYGIDRVFVADFDEFFYCSDWPPEAMEQGKRLRKYADSLATTHVEQSVYPMRIVGNQTASTSQCVHEKVVIAQKLYKDNATSANQFTAANLSNWPSIFDCWKPYRYEITIGKQVKSLHTGFACPWTTHHAACYPMRRGQFDPRLMDCLCNVTEQPRCSVVHLSLNLQKYHRGLREPAKYASVGAGYHDSLPSQRIELFDVINN